MAYGVPKKHYVDFSLNTAGCDNKPCHFCHKDITRVYKGRKLFGKTRQIVDKSNRVDCDASVGNEPEKLVTYHLSCYKIAVGMYDEPDTTGSYFAKIANRKGVD